MAHFSYIYGQDAGKALHVPWAGVGKKQFILMALDNVEECSEILNKLINIIRI